MVYNGEMHVAHWSGQIITTSLFSLTIIIVSKRKSSPFMAARFRLVNYYNLPRLLAMIDWFVNHYVPLLYDKIDIDSPLRTTINYDYYKPSVCSLKGGFSRKSSLAKPKPRPGALARAQDVHRGLWRHWLHRPCCCRTLSGHGWFHDMEMIWKSWGKA